jgi:hypothetical protein
MTRTGTITQKLIAGLFIGFGLLALVMQTWGLKIIWDTAARFYEGVEENKLSIVNFIFKSHYKIVLPALTIFSGAIILMKKKQRWPTGLIVSVLNITWLIFGLIRINKTNDPTEIMSLVIVAGVLVLFLTTFLILLNWTYRDRLSPATWGTMFLITTALFLDSLWAYNF